MLSKDVAPGIHMLTYASTNLYLVEYDDRVLIVDSGLPRVWPHLISALDELGRKPECGDGSRIPKWIEQPRLFVLVPVRMPGEPFVVGVHPHRHVPLLLRPTCGAHVVEVRMGEHYSFDGVGRPWPGH